MAKTRSKIVSELKFLKIMLLAKTKIRLKKKLFDVKYIQHKVGIILLRKILLMHNANEDSYNFKHSDYSSYLQHIKHAFCFSVSLFRCISAYCSIKYVMLL